MLPEPSLSNSSGALFVELDKHLVATLLQVVHYPAQALNLMQLIKLYHALRVVMLASQETLPHIQPLRGLLQLSLDLNQLVVSSHELSKRVSEEQLSLHLGLQLLRIVSQR